MAVSQPALAQPRPQRHRVFFAVIVAAVVAADQAGKVCAVALHQRAGHGMGLFGSSLLRNRGALFGVGAAWTLAITLLTLAALVGLVAAGLRACSRGAVVALLAGGAAGNGWDRLARAPGPLRGAVVDWIQLPVYPAVFNIADLTLRAGALVTVVLVLRTARPSPPSHSVSTAG